jgi:hypothetical protein
LSDTTFAYPDLITFCRLDELGLAVTGQRSIPIMRCWHAGSWSLTGGAGAPGDLPWHFVQDANMCGRAKNSMTSSVPVTSGIVTVVGAHLYYEVRGSGPLMALVGSPMHAEPFAPVAELLASDHTVLTADPRGHFGSVLDDPESDSTPELRAADLARLISHVDTGPATALSR